MSPTKFSSKKPKSLFSKKFSDLEAMTLQANEWIYSIKHHHLSREVSLKENDFNGSNYDEPESPRSDLNETPVPVIPRAQVPPID